MAFRATSFLSNYFDTSMLTPRNPGRIITGATVWFLYNIFALNDGVQSILE